METGDRKGGLVQITEISGRTKQELILPIVVGGTGK